MTRNKDWNTIVDKYGCPHKWTNCNFSRLKGNPNGLLNFLREQFPSEDWNYCKYWESRFVISSCGHVVSLSTYQPMRITILPNGYYYLPIIVQKPKRITHTSYLHRLIAATFIPNPQNKPQVNHKDGDKSNNCIENLEWVTQSENNFHATRILGHKRNTKKIEEYNKRRRLFSDEQVRLIRSKNLTKSQVRDLFGIDSDSVYEIKKFTTYKDVI